MEIDAVTVLSQKQCPIQTELTKKKLRSATGQLLEFVGQAIVKASVEGETKDLRIFVAKGNCPSLFGRDWIQYYFLVKTG